VTRNASGDLLLAWNRTKSGTATIEKRNEVVVRWKTPFGSGFQWNLNGARFPHWERGGTRLVYTQYQKNSATVMDPDGALEEAAEDGSYIGQNTGCAVYQQQALGNDDWKAPLASCKATSDDYTPQCGHASSPISGRRVVCSDTQLGLRSIRVSEIGNAFSLPSSFMRLNNYYLATDMPDCALAVEAYSSWGDRSDLLLVTVLCKDSLGRFVGSRLYLVRPPVTGIVQPSDVLDVSGALESAFGAHDLQFCTGDFITE
jgi:hypothetical protein